MPPVSRRLHAPTLAAAVLLSACGGKSGTGSITAALVTGEDLPGDWEFFKVSPPTELGKDLCGQPSTPFEPSIEASTAWAIDPDDGPIFGERIGQLESGDDAEAVVTHALDVPCTLTRSDGSRWRTEQLEPLTLGDASRIYLTTSLDRPDSFNYHVAIASDGIVLLEVLNTRTPNRDLLDELTHIAWSKAADEGVAE